MEAALYGPAGYYRRPDLPIGESGDYVTGSSFSPLFGRATARLLARLDRVLGRPADLLEVAYGTGAHLASVAAAAGPGRRYLAWDRIERPMPPISPVMPGAPGAPEVERVGELAEIPDGGIHGLVFSYELFDALPVHRLIGRPGGELGELWVAEDGAGGYAWQEGELSDPRLADLLRDPDGTLEPGQIADLSPGWAPLYGELARKLGRGLLVTCDYGFERERLLDPRVRRHGTLACYTRQRVHRNPFVKIGEQDLTAHVDFTALRQAGEAAGLSTVAFTRQALWLTACGLFEEIAEADPAIRREAMALLDGEGMGEEIRVLVQTRGVEAGEALDLAMLGRAPGGGPAL